MNREIEFRGKGKDNGEWVYGDLLQMDNGECQILGLSADRSGDVDPETVGQYTGIKIGGKKLFEHDVIRYRETGSDDWQYGVVVWCGGRDYPAFDAEPWIDCDCNGLSYIVAVCEAETIGNKWDNPELLEVEQWEKKHWLL